MFKSRNCESFTVIARADSAIGNFQDLRGKRVSIGKSGAGYTFTRDVVLNFYGWTISDFDRALELGPSEQNETLCSDKVDAIIFEAAHPDGLTQDTQTVLVANASQPDEVVYAVTRAVLQDLADFTRLHPALATLDSKDMVPSEAVMPIHPGALRHYREAGLVR